MNISYDVLKSYVEFGKSKNIYQAAENIGITQPAVSKHLKLIDSHFEVPLFATQGKKKVFTTLGQELFIKLKANLLQLDNTLKEVERKSKSPEKMTMRIGARPGAISSIIDNVSFPGSIQYTNMGGKDSMKAILNGEVDFCLSRDVPDSFDVMAKKIVEIGTHFVVHKDLLTKNSIQEMKDHSLLEQAPFYTYSETMPYIKEWCKNINFPIESLNVKGFLADWKTAIKLVQMNKGITLCPSGFHPHEKDLIVIPISKRMVTPLTLYLIYRKETKDLFPVNKYFNLEGIKDSLLSFEGFKK